MEHTFEIRVSQRDADTALRRFIFREAGWGMLVAAVLCAGSVMLDAQDGRLGALSIMILTLLGLLGLVLAAAFVTRRRQMADLLARLGDTPVAYRLDDSEISTRSALGSSSGKWQLIKKLWVDPDIVLVFYTRGSYTTIPTAQIPADALEFLVAQVRAVGGSVVDKRKRQGAA